MVCLQTATPIVADVGVAIGMGLHENQPCPRRGGGQFAGNAGTTVLLLRSGNDQDVAVRQDPSQPGERRVGRIEARSASERMHAVSRVTRPLACASGFNAYFLACASGFNVLHFRRVGIGAIDQHKVCQRGQILLHQIDFAGGNAKHLGGQPRAAKDRGAGRSWSVAAGANQLGPSQCVDERTLAGSASTQSGYNQRGF